jgi:putative transposase|tara:strand:- start:597 stop:812 length:216 start_codon:yes stop_codon:yes gene_type:complete
MIQSNIDKRQQFSLEIIQCTVWRYYRFSISHRDVQDLMAERVISVSYEAIRLWCKKFGPKYARPLRKTARK